MKRLLCLCAAIALVAIAKSPVYAATADLKIGRQTYNTYCANCHGVKGNGEGISAKWVNPAPRDFTACKLMAMYKDADLLKAIKDGGPAAFVSYAMPPWGSVLTGRKIADVLAYERSF
ncbi:MAG: c-type cytochrome, partial [Candidatus Binataceae bacterium]